MYHSFACTADRANDPNPLSTIEKKHTQGRWMGRISQNTKFAYNSKYSISGDPLWHECPPANFSENLAAYVASPIERQ